MRKALELLLFAAVGQEGKAAYWYLAAVQRHGKLLIPMLDEDNRVQLAAAFAEQYPVRQQLPMQKELYQLLAKEQKQKSGFLCSADKLSAARQGGGHFLVWDVKFR